MSGIAESDASQEWVIGEWDWWLLGQGERLHHALTWDPQGETFGHGFTSCGRGGMLSIPGMFTRMGAERCRKCCERMGYPQGTGSPKNDDACRPLVEAHEPHQGG